MNDSLELSERLMRRGWWAEAEAALHNPDVSNADRNLQTAALICRRECVEWMLDHSDTATMDDLLREFDRYTVSWVFNNYSGEGAEQWQGKRKANEKMD